MNHPKIEAVGRILVQKIRTLLELAPDDAFQIFHFLHALYWADSRKGADFLRTSTDNGLDFGGLVF